MMLTPMPERLAEPSSRTPMMALRVGTSWVVAPTPAWAAAMRKVFRLMSDGIPVETALSRGATLSTAWFTVECPSLTERVGCGGVVTVGRAVGGWGWGGVGGWRGRRPRCPPPGGGGGRWGWGVWKAILPG